MCGYDGILDQQQTGGGNPERLAPEVLNSSLISINYSKQPSWELGVVCHEILTLEHPFPSYPQAYGNIPSISHPVFKEEKLHQKDVPPVFVSVISKLLLPFNQRMAVEEANKTLESFDFINVG